jgi:hypothetical protein
VTHRLKRGQSDFEVDNRWVNPYNPWLSLKYDSHINLEYYTLIFCIKYIFKYVHKGYDCVLTDNKVGTYQEQQEAGPEGDVPTVVYDEITSHLDASLVSAPEATWRILKFLLTDRSHSISRLAVHLHEGQSVFFSNGQRRASSHQRRNKEHYSYCVFQVERATRGARQYFYREIPHHYLFDKQLQKWNPRKKRAKIIGRQYTVSVKQVERYCLRMLLINVKGATSFKHLRTVDDIAFPTFQAAAIALNLPEDDRAWEKTLEEVATFQMPVQLRQLFVDICLYCNPTNALQLFELNLPHLMEDYVRSGHEEEVAKNLTLKWIQDKLLLNNQLMENFSLPVPDFHLINQLIQAQIAADNDEVDTHEKRLLGQMMLEKLNDGQRAAFDLIMASIEDTNQPRLFFLDGPGGTSKMFLYNTLITVLQGQGKSVVAVASTGIASTLLSNGSTYHSKYKLYPPIT